MISMDTVATQRTALMLLIVIWVLTLLATACVVIRLCVRKYMHICGLDDCIIGLSMGIGLSFAVAATLSIHHGYGQHYKELNSEQASKALMWNVISLLLGTFVCALTKLAVAAHLDRIWGRVLSLSSRNLMWILTGMAPLFALVTIIIFITECKPLNALWAPAMVEAGQATCRDVSTLILFATFNGGEEYSP
ncbi:hypothetical protein N7539_008795 [Penicillium diatomitis]|uniref:Rhodopsin domain-containing protein n=1 Tax=Penicillium diatomitis TaxID=2819901 RepID=A0A9W9WQJ6_9EURO|nr:uncharacterized protein N7539_008795 [Penicillium diatomitis]KAJ5471852.1 hypothetical protein N7539_008795 [Penicillium diatomitis]